MFHKYKLMYFIFRQLTSNNTNKATDVLNQRKCLKRNIFC